MWGCEVWFRRGTGGRLTRTWLYISGKFLNTLKAIILSEEPLLYDLCHLRGKIWEWIFVVIDIVLKTLGLSFIYKIVTILICRRETTISLPIMKPGTKFSTFCSNKRHSDNQTCSPHTRDYAMNFLLVWSKLSVRNLQTILRKVTLKYNIPAPEFQYPNCGPFKYMHFNGTWLGLIGSESERNPFKY